MVEESKHKNLKKFTYKNLFKNIYEGKKVQNLQGKFKKYIIQ